MYLFVADWQARGWRGPFPGNCRRARHYVALRATQFHLLRSFATGLLYSSLKMQTIFVHIL